MFYFLVYLSAHAQNTVQPSLAIHSSCSPWHPKVHEHSSEQTLTGGVVVAGWVVVVSTGACSVVVVPEIG